MQISFQVQQDYGVAAEAVLSCDLAHYLAVLLRVAGIHEVSVSERNAAAATAYALASEAARQDAFRYCDAEPPDWSELLTNLRAPQVAACLFRDCCKVGWADGEIDPIEHEMLMEIARHLQLPDWLRDSLMNAVSEQETARLKVLSLFS
ncbi:TerB family tellurite resistance protein [bacterium]|nr:TerB family tellurite resistance protein [bacterium]